MRQSVRFTLALVAGLALLTWGASVIVTRTTRTWFERDMMLRAQLAVAGGREALVAHWTGGQEGELRKVLVDLTHDERILGAAACGADLRLKARTSEFPALLTCASLAAGVRPNADSPAAAWTTWSSVFPLPGGRVHVTATPLVDGDLALGFVVLVHDLSFVERREETTRRFLVLAFGFLALAASVVTVVAARLSWRGWSNELRRLIKGESSPPEFRPFLRDVRDLVERLAAEREADGGGGLWTPQRLKNTLGRHLHGERVIVVANREPYIHERTDDGKVELVHPASGLVTALEPVMRACSGVWVAHGSGSADREASDRRGRLAVPPGEESYVLRRLWLTPEEERGYYYGFANEGLWPLCHIAHTRPIFRSEDWRYYQEVNRRFADAACEEVDSDDAIILVQDYHFALVPRMIRERLPRATVLTFWHIPWPNSEQFGICPWRNELLSGLLGSSILGFHTQFHCNNFLDGVDRFLESRIDREQTAVVHQGHQTFIRPYPISIEWPGGWARTVPPAAECRASVFAELGLGHDALLGVGVDRLDYTKGIEERLRAVERLLERLPSMRGRFTFVQLAAPSRTIIPNYQALSEKVARIAERVNERFASAGYRPVILKRAHHEPPTVFRYYRAADVCYVSSLHDGMNLVAKEFIAAREDEQGVLVLSHFTGAARELTEALAVNPYDLEEASAALAAALQMPKDEQRDRMRSMRALVAEFNVYRWAGRMLVDAARLRRRERLTGRLTGVPEAVGTLL
jgi:trehalose 6-phosphate synthase